MTDPIFKQLELTGTSTTSIEDAVNNAIARASNTIHNLRWFEVIEIRGAIKDNAVGQWQVTMKVAFTLDE